MAGTKTGSPTVWRLVRKICQVVRRYGARDLATLTDPDIATAVGVLVIACEAFLISDDFPAEIDATPPTEDIDIEPA